MTVVTLASAININMIIDKKQWQLPKPISNRSGYDMEYYRTCLRNYWSGIDFKKFLANEKIYNKLSIMRKGESPGYLDQEWSDPLSDLGRVRVKQQAFDKFKYRDSVRDEPHSLTPPILEQVPSEDIEWIKKLQSFGTEKKLVLIAFEDLCSLSKMKALVIDTEAWHEDANANL
ncbi:hypothetical protein C1645_812340 [Glomus cerebriforme]|uniref:Uncharacterized protein n=1 Tax=Glomus cerebriforme TaxID=658196 RepID=A0A397TKS8_9GLOM|nr:hypothetical protein C1645_812340 [Glomus cerebriforme]